MPTPRRSSIELTPAQRGFIRDLAHRWDRPMRAVLDDALMLLEAVVADDNALLGGGKQDILQIVWEHYRPDRGIKGDTPVPGDSQ